MIYFIKTIHKVASLLSFGYFGAIVKRPRLNDPLVTDTLFHSITCRDSARCKASSRDPPWVIFLPVLLSSRFFVTD